MDTNEVLLQTLGISPDQIESRFARRTGAIPEYFGAVIEKSRNLILDVLTDKNRKEPQFWAIDEDKIKKVFADYEIVPSFRKAASQYGRCDYRKQRITINFGNKKVGEAEAYSTLLHEYVHAILYEIVGRNFNHGKEFIFYLTLLCPNRYTKRITGYDLIK